MKCQITVPDRIGPLVAGLLPEMMTTRLPARTMIVLTDPDCDRLGRLLRRLDDAGVQIQLLRLRVTGPD